MVTEEQAGLLGEPHSVGRGVQGQRWCTVTQSQNAPHRSLACLGRDSATIEQQPRGPPG